MFSFWADDEAMNEGRGPDGQAHFWFGHKMLRIRLVKYLALLGLVKEEPQNLEMRLESMA